LEKVSGKSPESCSMSHAPKSLKSLMEKVSGKSLESCSMTHAPKSLKSLLEKVSGQSPESLPGFFDPVSFELKYLYQVR